MSAVMVATFLGDKLLQQRDSRPQEGDIKVSTEKPEKLTAAFTQISTVSHIQSSDSMRSTAPPTKLQIMLIMFYTHPLMTEPHSSWVCRHTHSFEPKRETLSCDPFIAHLNGKHPQLKFDNYCIIQHQRSLTGSFKLHWNKKRTEELLPVIFTCIRI